MEKSDQEPVQVVPFEYKPPNTQGGKSATPSPGELTLDRVPNAPRDLGTAGKFQWKAIGQCLLDLQKLGPTDLIGLRLLCEYYDEQAIHSRQLEKLGEDGRVYTVDNGARTIHPHYKAWMDCSARILTLLKEFGLTPASRNSASKAPKRKGKVASKSQGTA